MRLQGHAAVLDRRADVHHAAAVITQPKVVRRFGYVECSEEVDVDHRFESVRAEVADRDGEVSGGIVDNNVEPTEGVQHLLDNCRDLVVPADIADAIAGLNPLSPQPLDRRLKIGFLAAADRDASAMTAQDSSDLQAKAGSAAGDQRHLPLQEIGPEWTFSGEVRQSRHGLNRTRRDSCWQAGRCS